MSFDDANNNPNDANKTRLRIKIKRWHGVAKWTWGVGDDEDDVCIVCQSAFEGVAPGVKYPGDECPVVVSVQCPSLVHSRRAVCVSRWSPNSKSTRLTQTHFLHHIFFAPSGGSVDMRFICSACRRGFKVKIKVKIGE